MQQSSTLYAGMDVHKAPITVAYVAQDYAAEGIALGGCYSTGAVDLS